MDKEIEQFLKLVQRNDIHCIKEFINKSVGDAFKLNTFCRRKSGDSALHIASKEGYLEILKYFVEEHGGNIELGNLDGKTCLHEAAQFSRLGIVRYLISQGANVNALKKADWTPLMLACTKNNLEIIQILLSNGADPLFQNKDGWNCLHISCREGYLKIVKAVLIHSNSKQLCRTRSKNGRSPLHTCIMHGHEDIMKLLLDQFDEFETPYCNVNATDHCGTTPLMDACRFGFLNLMKILIANYNAELYLTNSIGMNALHIAAEAGQIYVVPSLIIHHGMNVNAPTPMGLTPLHFSVRENQVAVIRELLKLGASLEIRDNMGHTCIDMARRLNKTNALEELLNTSINI